MPCQHRINHNTVPAPPMMDCFQEPCTTINPSSLKLLCQLFYHSDEVSFHLKGNCFHSIGEETEAHNVQVSCLMLQAYESRSLPSTLTVVSLCQCSHYFTQDLEPHPSNDCRKQSPCQSSVCTRTYPPVVSGQ